jgi:hypothetical protein
MRIHKCQRMQNRSAFTAVTAGRSLAAAAAERSLTADGAAAGRSLTAAAAERSLTAAAAGLASHRRRGRRRRRSTAIAPATALCSPAAGGGAAAADRPLTAAAAWSGEQILLPHLSFEPEKQLMTRTLHSFRS